MRRSARSPSPVEAGRYPPDIEDDVVGAHIDAARRGDRAAVEEVLRAAYPRVAALCRRMMGNDADGADAAQEALIAIARGLPRFDGRSRASTWMYRVATNACLDELRRRGRRPEPVDDVTATSALGRSDAPSGARSDPDLHLDVQAALARLPLEFRAPVVLRDLCGLDYAEIAEVLAIPPGTVRSRIARARHSLAPLLAGNHDPVDDRPTSSP